MRSRSQTQFQFQSQKNQKSALLPLVCAAALFSILIFGIQSSLFSGPINKNIDLSEERVRISDLNPQQIRILSEFQTSVQQCVANRGLGLTAHIIDHCKLILKFPEGTNSTWYNAQFKIYEPLEYSYDICDAILLWEQYRNMTTVLTREYLDVRPDGWLDYAAKRIAQLGTDKCYNRTLCEEHLNMLLPAKPPFHPRQFRTCAVVGNSGDLLKTTFGEEIDSHDAVIRDNEAPVNEKYAKYVGLKRDFRLVVRGAARNMVKILKGSDDEVLIIKSVTHRDFNDMIKTIPNPVYLFQGIVLRRGAKGTGMKSIELALSMCNIVDIYGFTVDPGYTEWTRYFSTPRKGHNPLQGRAYYQLLECLEHSLPRGKSPLHSVKWERIILDEAHFVKDSRSNTAKAVLSLESLYKWALSGTPLQNRVGELYSLVRFLQKFRTPITCAKIVTAEFLIIDSDQLSFIMGRRIRLELEMKTKMILMQERSFGSLKNNMLFSRKASNGITLLIRVSDADEDGVNARKKLRHTKEQSAFLKESFKRYNTLNPPHYLHYKRSWGNFNCGLPFQQEQNQSKNPNLAIRIPVNQIYVEALDSDCHASTMTTKKNAG
ncbi:hypothetical protein GQ457_04G011580 [Hibiscus cannabinus]